MRFDARIKSDEEVLDYTYKSRLDVCKSLLDKWKEMEIEKILIDFQEKKDVQLNRQIISQEKKTNEKLSKLERRMNNKMKILYLLDNTIVITDDMIRERAFMISQQRHQGSDEKNWQLAQQELLNKN